jgi:hypothetical protein
VLLSIANFLNFLEHIFVLRSASGLIPQWYEALTGNFGPNTIHNVDITFPIAATTGMRVPKHAFATAETDSTAETPNGIATVKMVHEVGTNYLTHAIFYFQMNGYSHNGRITVTFF